MAVRVYTAWCLSLERFGFLLQVATLRDAVGDQRAEGLLPTSSRALHQCYLGFCWGTLFNGSRISGYSRSWRMTSVGH